MAIYHLSIKTIARSAGRSATAAAAYRSASKIADRASGLVFDYTQKRGVEYTEIVLPTKLALQDVNWARDRQALWNAAEQAERRKDARVAREYELAIPHELPHAPRVALVRDFSQYLATRYGVAVDFAIHRAHWQGDQRNYHAHVLTTTREVTPAGLGVKTALELSETDRARRGMPHSREEFVEIRERWASLGNDHLKSGEHEARIDHRTLAAQGIDRQPSIHWGAAVTGLIRRGIESRVERRVAWQEQEAALQRVRMAIETGLLDRVPQRLDAGLLDLSTNLGAARQESEAAKRVGRSQLKSREAWLSYRTLQERAKSEDTPAPVPLRVSSRDGTSVIAKQRPAIALDREGQGLES